MRLPIALACLGLAACATSPEHDNFKQVMSRQVGKMADDPDLFPTLYGLRQTNSQRLPNGNTREEYAAGRNARCKLYFDVAASSRRIVAWSFDGDQRDCIIPRGN